MESAVATSMQYYASHPRLSREGYRTEISPKGPSTLLGGQNLELCFVHAQMSQLR